MFSVFYMSVFSLLDSTPSSSFFLLSSYLLHLSNVPVTSYPYDLIIPPTLFSALGSVRAASLFSVPLGYSNPTSSVFSRCLPPASGMFGFFRLFSLTLITALPVLRNLTILGVPVSFVFSRSLLSRRYFPSCYSPTRWDWCSRVFSGSTAPRKGQIPLSGVFLLDPPLFPLFPLFSRYLLTAPYWMILLSI